MIKNGTDKITVLEMFMIMVLSRLIVTLLYIPGAAKPLNVSDTIMQVFFAALILALFAIPSHMFLKDGNNNGFLTRCSNVSPVLSKLCAAFIFLSFAFLGTRVIMRFEIFTTTVIFPQSNLKFFLIILLLACLYCAVLGLDVLGRTAEIFFAVVILSIVFIIAVTIPKMKFTNFTPVFVDGVMSPFSAAFYSVSVSVELFYPVFLKDKVHGKKTLLTYPWIGSMFGFLAVLAFCQAGVLGNYSSTQLFPFFTFTSMSSLGFIERLDALLTAVWIVCEFVKMCMYILICGKCINTVFKKTDEKSGLCISTIVFAVITLLVRENYRVRDVLSNTTVAVVIFAVMVVAMPLCVMISEKVTSEKGEKLTCQKISE